jgi:hypothetical protein
MKPLVARFIREILYPDWLANPMLVQKDSNKWHMCVDYIDLNRHCPKDPFGLPCIDQIVDLTAGSALSKAYASGSGTQPKQVHLRCTF